MSQCELSSVPPIYRTWALKMIIDGYHLEDILTALYKAEGIVVEEVRKRESLMEDAGSAPSNTVTTKCPSRESSPPLSRAKSDASLYSSSQSAGNGLLGVWNTIRSTSFASLTNSSVEHVYSVGETVEVQRNNGSWVEGVISKICDNNAIKVDYYCDGSKWRKKLPTGSSAMRPRRT